MNVDLFIHGIPKGRDFFGQEDDQTYFERFADTDSKEESKLIVETRKFNNRNYCYYTYIKSKNVVDVDNRAGSYFGISLRFDVYLRDVVAMYQLFDIVYSKYVLGSLLKEEGQKIKFLSHSFSAKQNEIKKIEDSFLQLIQLSFSGNDFVKIEENMINKVSGTPEYYLFDCTKENILSAILKYSRVVISPDYPTNKELTIKKEFENRLNAKEKEVADAKNQFFIKEKQLTQQLSEKNTKKGEYQRRENSLNKKIEELQNDVKRKDEELKKSASFKDIQQSLTSINESISRLTKEIDKIIPKTEVAYPDDGETKREKTREWRNYLPSLKIRRKYLLAIFLFAVLSIFAFVSYLYIETNKYNSYQRSSYNEISKLEPQINDLQRENINLKNELDSQIQIGKVENSENGTNPSVAITPKINIGGFNGKGNLKIGQEYTASIKDFAENGAWKVDGFTFNVTSNNGVETVKIKPNREGKVVISFYQGETKIATRELIAEK